MASVLLGPPADAAAGQALVVGEASYATLPPLPGCALSAHAMAAALRRLGFSVDEQDDVSSGALYGRMDALARHMTAAPGGPVFVYLCGYAMGYNDRSFLLPVDASVAQPSDILAQGVLLRSVLNAMADPKPATGVLTVDAVPVPKATAPLSLDGLEKPALPRTLGYIAVADNAPGNIPMPLAATLVPMMKAPPLQAAALLTQTHQQLSGLNDAGLAALRLPDEGLYLAGAPPVAVPVVAPATAPAVPSLPDESAMTADQRRLVQRALSHLGYYDGKPDGIFGPDTKAAIRRWQYEEHKPMTGHLTAEESSKLAATWD
jgi:hypothetical protein